MNVYDTTVPRAILVIPELDPAPLSAEARAGLPRLPSLEQWLARGESQALGGDWRQWLLRWLGAPSQAVCPAASIAGAAVAGVPGDRPLWLATPVHLVPGLDTVRVHPAGLLTLTAPEQQSLQQDFARDFAGTGCTLHATGRRELLLALGEAYEAGEVRSDDPAMWLGADPREGWLRGPGSAPLRRLGAELEMWLHGHHVNDARSASGQLGVSALWIWGGGAALARAAETKAGPAPGPDAIAWADELFVDGLARCMGWRSQPLPPTWPLQPAPTLTPALRLVVAGLREAGRRSLESIDRDWIAPALAEWRQGSHELMLVAARSVVTLRRRSLRRAWRALRRPRPWWRGLQAC